MQGTRGVCALKSSSYKHELLSSKFVSLTNYFQLGSYNNMMADAKNTGFRQCKLETAGKPA